MPVGPIELIVLLVIIVLFFGASRIPKLGRSIGEASKEFRASKAEIAAERERQADSAALDGSSAERPHSST